MSSRGNAELLGRRLRQLPHTRSKPSEPIEVWASRDWFVQVYEAEGCVERISVNRSKRSNGREWDDGITWDELQELKALIGRGDRWAVECFPPDELVVNDANMRHLLVLDEAPAYGWVGNRPRDWAAS